ncbi:phage tail protein [Angustibacter peucedani]
MAIRDDPYGRFNVLVDLGTGDPGSAQAGFAEVSGLGTSIDVIEYRNGNDKSGGVRKLPGLRRYPNLVLKRGITGDTSLWQWISQTPPDKRTVVVTLLDETRQAVRRYVLTGAFPVKLTGPDLSAESSEVAMETLELSYEGLRVDDDD